MEVFPTPIPEVILFRPQVFSDARGSFFESFQVEKLRAIGIAQNFVQDNQSHSSKGVLRGLHYQTGSYAQAKLVRVIQGEVLDVAVDIRRGSPTFGKYVSAVLSGTNHMQMLVPRGFAHGFIVRENDTIFSYKCDNFYHKEAEGGIIWNDSNVQIDWQLENNEVLLSEKDAILPSLELCKNDFVYA
jgi:dTDP-4-dehydrorhamnose 3,5-epimerase